MESIKDSFQKQKVQVIFSAFENRPHDVHQNSHRCEEATVLVRGNVLVFSPASDNTEVEFTCLCHDVVYIACLQCVVKKEVKPFICLL